MTVENRRFVELIDILAVQFECKQCGARLSCPIRKWKQMKFGCPNCNAPWVTEGSIDYRTLESLLANLKLLAEHQSTEGKFTFRLELGEGQ